MSRALSLLRRHPLRVATIIALLIIWEAAARLAPLSTIEGSPLVPSIGFTFGDALKGLSDHWLIDRWAPRPRHGGEQTYLGAFLALGYHSWQTLQRLVMGLLAGVVVGIGSGLIVSYWIVVRRIAWSQMNFLRMVPLLAAIPLAQFWLGANTRGVVIFVAFGVWVVLVVATINAVANVPDRFIESARTLGASRIRTYFQIIIPGALPELRTSLLLAAGFSWSLTIGAEYLGLGEGLGPILAASAYFTNTGRMVVVAGLATFYAWLGFVVLDRLASRTLKWMPEKEGASIAAEGAGAAGVGGGGLTETHE